MSARILVVDDHDRQAQRIQTELALEHRPVVESDPEKALLTARGPVVLASDASHFYANFETGRAFPIMHNHEATLLGYEKMKRLSQTPNGIIPGHDPLVTARYPASIPGLEGIVMRLDLEPTM